MKTLKTNPESCFLDFAMETILLFVNPRKSSAVRAVETFRSSFGKSYHLVEVDPQGSRTLPTDEATLAIVFGGDGSVLAAARLLGGRPIPLVGVNVGKMGFLAELTEAELNSQLADILSGHGRVVERLMLQAQVRTGDALSEPRLALNDVVLSGGSRLRMITVTLLVNGEETITYDGDGIIVSTPLGSTAYSLSAGGPIATPNLDVLIVTPICPHSLTNRSLVVPAESELELVPVQPERPTAVTLDGQELIELSVGQQVLVKAAPNRLKLVETGTRTFFTTLREKMNWGGRPPAAGNEK